LQISGAIVTSSLRFSAIAPQSRLHLRAELAHLESTKRRTGMTERQDRLATEREEIASRIARFKATQEKFAREREEYAAATMENALNHAPRWPSQKSVRTG
jgi:chorismate mutase